jgi:hypothetical protein
MAAGEAIWCCVRVLGKSLQENRNVTGDTFEDYFS